MGKSHKCAVITAALAWIFPVTAENRLSTREHLAASDATGRLETYQADGVGVAAGKRLFQAAGRNGRSCASCHNSAQGWTIAASEVQARFEATRGLDPIFRPDDGANCDHNIDTSNPDGRRAAYSLLTHRGLIRVALSVPSDAEFEVVRVNNPYGCDSRRTLSLYRRPLPATNLRALTSVMWDGRGSSAQTRTQPITNSSGLIRDLMDQVEEASRIHLQPRHPMTEQDQQSIVNFEMALATAQASDSPAGPLNADGARGGPVALAEHTLPAFFVGINDPHEGNPHSIKPENAIRLYDAWSVLPYGRIYREFPAAADPRSNRRASIARGQVLFDQKPFDIKGVPGLNDDQHLPSITGACGTCHDSPDIGNHSVEALFRTGVDEAGSALDVGYLPSITLRNKMTGETAITTDPGLALITGHWRDIGKFKVPILRGLIARPPYFHNGSAQTLADVVGFYDARFHIHFSQQEKEDLVAFLSVL